MYYPHLFAYIVLLALPLRTVGNVNEKINFAGGYAPAEWDYASPTTTTSAGVYGWSYYMRAFNLLREQPTQELGWGQWSKPASPPSGLPLKVCGMHPAGFLCEETPTITADCLIHTVPP